MEVLQREPVAHADFAKQRKLPDHSYSHRVDRPRGRPQRPLTNSSPASMRRMPFLPLLKLDPLQIVQFVVLSVLNSQTYSTTNVRLSWPGITNVATKTHTDCQPRARLQSGCSRAFVLADHSDRAQRSQSPKRSRSLEPHTQHSRHPAQ